MLSPPRTAAPAFATPRLRRGKPPHLRTSLAVLMLSFTAAGAVVPLIAAVRPPKLQYETMLLPNGLRVILSEDHSTPIVHVSIWYHVGSKNERAGRTGFAHLFEHMMFKGSKNVEPELHTSLIASVGGRSNAYTTEDETVFWQTFPQQYLPLVLWLEADRMATLRVNEEAFKREREVVKEERRMRVENQPYGRLNEIIYDHAFVTHPYKHPTIGSMADLEAASIEDVREFHRQVLDSGSLPLSLLEEKINRWIESAQRQ
jgi:zinc protease